MLSQPIQCLCGLVTWLIRLKECEVDNSTSLRADVLYLTFRNRASYI